MTSATTRLSNATNKRLERLAAKTHRSKSFFIREAIENQIEDLEDYYLSKTVLNNPMTTYYTQEEVEKLCGLGD